MNSQKTTRHNYHPISDDATQDCDVSVVIPVYNEVEGLDVCFAEVRGVLDASIFSYELIFVDDGSTDGSLEKMLSFHEKDPCVTVIQLRRNCGQQQALMVGLREIRGRAVVTYDADLQFAPECIPQLVEKILEGADIASGIRAQRKDSALFNRLPSSFGLFLVNRALRIKQTDFGAVKAYSRALVEEILLLPSDFLVIPAAAYALNKNFVEIPVKHQPRMIGHSKWSVLKRMETYFDIYVSYAQRPFEWMMIGGFISVILSMILGIGIFVFRVILSKKFAGTIIFFDVFLFFLGIHFIGLSLIGEFVARIFRSRKSKKGEMVLHIHRGSSSQ